MESSWNTALWRQVGAAIDMLDNAIIACPASLWNQRLWNTPADLSPDFAAFWYLAYHTLFWLDLYRSGAAGEDYAPPAPFTRVELDPAGVLPERPYSREELRACLVSIRETCRTTLVGLTDEQARRPIAYPWTRGQSVSYLELQLYNLRHLQEHTAQLSLFLGQHGVPDAEIDWVARAPVDAGGH